MSDQHNIDVLNELYEHISRVQTNHGNEFSRTFRFEMLHFIFYIDNEIHRLEKDVNDHLPFIRNCGTCRNFQREGLLEGWCMRRGIAHAMRCRVVRTPCDFYDVHPKLKKAKTK